MKNPSAAICPQQLRGTVDVAALLALGHLGPNGAVRACGRRMPFVQWHFLFRHEYYATGCEVFVKKVSCRSAMESGQTALTISMSMPQALLSLSGACIASGQMAVTSARLLERFTPTPPRQPAHPRSDSLIHYAVPFSISLRVGVFNPSLDSMSTA
ncbi:hypothetical protein [Burkholderia sp. Ac-20353]|uniref:hypothetical protein n=1 Tax=Burkholderia sp. Ac-20353 TaxID=2703894 RepID=UPI00197C3F70|nr:hypothetical protein [Burkholderia sp. Ac-20353]MBN3786071.1 hypothetical protein [Burkholderia sp. Ac-20353]